MYTTLFAIVAAVVVGIGLASRVPSATTRAVGKSTLTVGDRAPAFSADTDAGKFDLRDVSSPVLLEVFAPRCPHCQKETVALNDLATRYAGKILIVSVSGDPYDYEHQQAETRENVIAFARRFDLRYPVAFDPEFKVASLYLHAGFPPIYVMDRNKKIVYQVEGEIPERDIEKAIRSVI